MKFTAIVVRALSPVTLVLALACTPAGETETPFVQVQSSLTGTDLTPTSAANVAENRNRSRDFPLANVHDNNAATKLYVPKPDDWIRYRMAQPAIIVSYDIVSADDHPERDPKNWTFEGSNDAIGWTVLNTQVDQVFATRFQTKSYTFSNSTPYLYYRLNISDNAGGDDVGDMQLAELRIGGSVVTGTLPGVPAITSVTVNSNAVTLSWSAATNATGYFVQRTDNDRTVTEAPASGTTYTDTNLLPGTTYVYQVQAVNSTRRGFPSAFRRATTPGFSLAGLKDVTALSTAAPTEQFPSSGGVVGEEVDKVTDNNPNSKYIELGRSSTWIKLETPADAVITRYTLTSGNDVPGRDPQSWTLEGSNNDSTWTVLDTRAAQSFVDRLQTRTFTCNTASQPFRYYRLTILSNRGDAHTQLSEWRLFGTTSATLAGPAAPSGLTAQALSGHQIRLLWTDNAGQRNPEASYRVERATNSTFTQNLVVKSTGAGSTEFRATGLSPSTTYFFRVAAVNAVATSATVTASATTTTSTPPATLSESGWDNVYSSGFNRTLFQTYTDANVAVYYDEFVPNRTTITWVNPAMSQSWSRVKANYGDMVNPVLYVVGNATGISSRFEGGGIFNAFDSRTDYRNLVFVHSWNWTEIGGPPEAPGWNLGALTHEMGHVVEGANNTILGSPSFPVWNDSQWAEIFQYDLYANVAAIPPEVRDMLYTNFQTSIDAAHGRHWFRDWYYPLYTGSFGNTAADKKGVALLVKYFQLIAEHHQRVNHAYRRDFNFGELIHFYSAAAGTDLEDEARVAFFWTPEVEIQLAKAYLEFPGISALYRPNAAPGFTFDPMTRTASVGVALTGTLVGTAVDPNPSDTLTYSKQSGPTWLTVASNGALGGTPPSAGTFTATVRVTDQGGLFDSATLNITAGGSCTPETDAAFCARLAATCGTLSGTDNCGAPRTVTSCGSCTAPQTCGGGGTPNACGGGSTATACTDLCAGPVPFEGPNYNSGNLGTGAICRETTATLTGANCGNFASTRTFRVNNELRTCNGGNITLPPKRNGGYCFQASAGDFAWAYFATW
jgi:hypothetical protein